MLHRTRLFVLGSRFRPRPCLSLRDERWITELIYRRGEQVHLYNKSLITITKLTTPTHSLIKFVGSAVLHYLTSRTTHRTVSLILLSPVAQHITTSAIIRLSQPKSRNDVHTPRQHNMYYTDARVLCPPIRIMIHLLLPESKKPTQLCNIIRP